VEENGEDSMEEVEELEEQVANEEEPVTCDSDSADTGHIVSEDQIVLDDKINPEDKVEIKVEDDITDMLAQIATN
jgi:hypothetical protein